jgi:outer membrane protein
MLKRILVILILVILCGGAAFSQAMQITRVAVVDLPRVYQVFFRESQAVREFEERSNRVQADIERLQAEINELRSRHADAVSRGNQTEAVRLEGQIHTRSEYLREFFQVRTAELNAQRARLMQSDAFINQIQNEVRFIAETEGYSLVIDLRSATGIVWYSSSIDITDRLIQRLQARSR